MLPAMYSVDDAFAPRTSTNESPTGYMDNPYHNWYHAVDVLQTIGTLLLGFDGTHFLSPLEKLSLLLAGLAHDVKHPGLNNVYQVNARTPLATLYNDQSVLEHHHASSFFRLVSSPSCNILQALNKEDYLQVRKIIVSGILATDMTTHFTVLQKFNKFVESEQLQQFKAEVGIGTIPTHRATSTAQSVGSFLSHFSNPHIS
jgi:hypothetical protein